MDSLDLIKTFREVASHGSFSQAAKNKTGKKNK